MRNAFWDDLVRMADGEKLNYQPHGFIIDSPWIPGWFGISTVDYYASDELWLKANLKAIDTFPDTWFMPSFWSEYGMCTEPSAFGARMIFVPDSLPHADRVLAGIEAIDSLPQPNVKSDGLLPFMISRLRNNEKTILEVDHKIRFAIARGPMNIASFLMGTTEFMMALAMDPEGSHKLLGKITEFVCDWLSWQKECFPTIEGVLVLDDLMGFIGEAEFTEFALPYFKKIFASTSAKVRFLHNDAEGLITAKYLKEMGVNLFNFSFKHTMEEIRELAGPDVILLGNIPARDTMGSGTPQMVDEAVKKAFGEIKVHDRIIWSAGGGMPPDVKDENIHSFINAVKEYSK